MINDPLDLYGEFLVVPRHSHPRKVLPLIQNCRLTFQTMIVIAHLCSLHLLLQMQILFQARMNCLPSLEQLGPVFPMTTTRLMASYFQSRVLGRLDWKKPKCEHDNSLNDNEVSKGYYRSLCCKRSTGYGRRCCGRMKRTPGRMFAVLYKLGVESTHHHIRAFQPLI
jgi:hypothetical protein